MYKFLIILESFSHEKCVHSRSAFVVLLTAYNYSMGIRANATDDFPYLGRKIKWWLLQPYIYIYIYEWLSATT